MVAVLTGCADEGPRLSIEEAETCASEEFQGHPGTFSERDNTIAYSYASPNGPATIIVTFDGRRRPVRTFFESAPHGSHRELMDAAQAIKDCVEFGRKEQGPDRRDSTSVIHR
ncbi:MAG: hypothetical protein AB7G08_28525 [Hyphomicrobiaceae bacterium]